MPPVCNTMRTYTIKPLDFSEPQTDEQSDLPADCQKAVTKDLTL